MRKIKVSVTRDGKNTDNVMPLDAAHCKVLRASNMAVLVPDAISEVCKYILQPGIKVNIQTMED